MIDPFALALGGRDTRDTDYTEFDVIVSFMCIDNIGASHNEIYLFGSPPCWISYIIPPIPTFASSYDDICILMARGKPHPIATHFTTSLYR